MPKRIKEDHKHFRDVVSGLTRRELKRLIKTGQIVRERPRGGRLTATIPRLDIPHFVHGDNRQGVGRGKGKEGDIIGRDPPSGQGSQGAGDDSADGIRISIDMEYVTKLMGEDLKLPRLRPKPNQTHEEVKIRYNDISRYGPESLRHNKRTLREAIKRLAASGNLEQLQLLPGSRVPLRLISLTNNDKRYRQYNEIRIPSSNAVIFFARDCSGSMDALRCEIVSDMAWWLDCWIRLFYKRVDRCYYVHDTKAQEVDEETFYTYRYGGGTFCSTAFTEIAEQLKNRYPPSKFNVYIFYFTDGDNWDGDNEKMLKVLQEELGPEVVNLIGIAQVLPWNEGEDSVKQFIDSNVAKGKLNADYLRTYCVKPNGGKSNIDSDSEFPDRDEQVINGIRHFLTEKETAK